MRRPLGFFGFHFEKPGLVKRPPSGGFLIKKSRLAAVAAARSIPRKGLRELPSSSASADAALGPRSLSSQLRVQFPERGCLGNCPSVIFW